MSEENGSALVRIVCNGERHEQPLDSARSLIARHNDRVYQWPSYSRLAPSSPRLEALADELYRYAWTIHEERYKVNPGRHDAGLALKKIRKHADAMLQEMRSEGRQDRRLKKIATRATRLRDEINRNTLTAVEIGLMGIDWDELDSTLLRQPENVKRDVLHELATMEISPYPRGPNRDRRQVFLHALAGWYRRESGRPGWFNNRGTGWSGPLFELACDSLLSCCDQPGAKLSNELVVAVRQMAISERNR